MSKIYVFAMGSALLSGMSFGCYVPFHGRTVGSRMEGCSSLTVLSPADVVVLPARWTLRSADGTEVHIAELTWFCTCWVLVPRPQPLL